MAKAVCDYQGCTSSKGVRRHNTYRESSTLSVCVRLCSEHLPVMQKAADYTVTLTGIKAVGVREGLQLEILDAIQKTT